MKNHENAFRRSVDARLSGLRVSEAAQKQILRRAQEKEETVVKKKISLSLALALLAMLALAATACAAVLRYGALDYNSDQKENETFIEHIVSVDQDYENDYLSLSVNEAVFDGTHLSMTMNIRPKDGAGEVYVIPRITAEAGGRELEVDIEGCRGGDFFSGFFVPAREVYAGTPDGSYGVDAAIIREEGDGIFYDVENESVTWTVTFHVLKPEYEVLLDDTVLTGDDSDEGGDPPMEEYMQRFKDAYEKGQILLAYGYSLAEYSAILPDKAGRSEDALVASGAFSRADTIIAQFETGSSGAKVLDASRVYDMGEYECTVTSLTATFVQVDYTLEVRKKPGHGKEAAQEYVDGDGCWEFVLLVPGRTTTPWADGYGIEGFTPEEPGDAVRYSGTVRIDGEAESVIFVPVWQEPQETAEEETTLTRKVWNAQKPLTKEQEDLAFEVKL